jgi:hypothetical protein
MLGRPRFREAAAPRDRRPCSSTYDTPTRNRINRWQAAGGAALIFQGFGAENAVRIARLSRGTAMPYTDRAQFLVDFKAAQTLAGEAYKGYFKVVPDDVAWSAYTNSAKKMDSTSNTLGLMLFGRHAASIKKPIIDAFTRRQDEIAQKHLKLSNKRFVPKAYVKSWHKKATSANNAQKDRELGEITGVIETDKDSAMRKNFGVVNNNETGSILLMGNTNWNLTINDTWLLGAVHSQLEFYPASPVSRANIFDDKHVLSITGRELFGLAIFGYRQVIPEYAELGSAFVVSDPNKAKNATLVAYQQAMSGISSAVANKAFSDAGFRIVEVGV